MDENIIVGGINCNKYNYNKMAMLQGLLQGKEFVIVDDGEEYKSLCDNLGIDYNKVKGGYGNKT